MKHPRELCRLHRLHYADEAGPFSSDNELVLQKGARVALVGSNHAGKSALLRILAGMENGHAGDLEFSHPGTTVGHFDGEPAFDPGRRVSEVLQDAVSDLRAIEKRYNEVRLKIEGRENEFHALKEQMDRLNVWDLDQRIQVLARAFQLPSFDDLVQSLNEESRRRLALCKWFLVEPELLLLDEPEKGLSEGAYEALVWGLRNYPGTWLVHSRDEAFLELIASWTLTVNESITLLEKPLIAGLARLSKGAALSGWTVVATPVSRSGPAPRVATTGSDGHFELHLSCEGECRVELFKDECHWDTREPDWWPSVQPHVSLPSVFTGTHDLLMAVQPRES